MSDANRSDPDADNRRPQPPEVFPDPATCRVKDAGLGGYFYCVGAWAWRCPHSLSYGSGSHFCLHPTAAVIFERSEGQR